MSHSSCGIVFADDGTLLVPTGDGAAYGGLDNGGGTTTYAAQALADSIITQPYNVGAFRSQMINSINGKILRIDPSNGNGVPSNPFYDTTNPSSAQSKVWSMGLRNPFRIAIRPGSGSSSAADGKPGVIYIGDVGWAEWEDLHIATKPGQNFGWPIYEGMETNFGYKNLLTPNFFAPNPLYVNGSCMQPFFYFQDLLMQATLDSTKTFKNPCDTSSNVPATIFTSQHSRPGLTYRHKFDSTLVAAFNGVDAVAYQINDSLAPCQGQVFSGGCIIGGTFYTGNSFPSIYKNKYYMAEFNKGFIKCIATDTNDAPILVDNFANSLGDYVIVHIEQNPHDGSLVYVKYPDEIRKICYACMPDGPPIAKAIADTTFGGDTLLVNFNGSFSTDPDNAPLTYLWSFGDGNTSTLVNPQHLYASQVAGLLTTFTATLTVTDDSSHTDTDTLLIVLNNTPPQVLITTVNDSGLYSVITPTNLILDAQVTDAQHAPSQLFYSWQTTIHINGNDSIIATDTNKISSVNILPLGCLADTVYYTISLTVTDILGMVGYDKKNIYPDCNAPAAGYYMTANSQCSFDMVQFTDTSHHFPTAWQWTFTGGNPASSSLQSPVVNYNAQGIFPVVLHVTNAFGTNTISDSISTYNLPIINLLNDTSI
ncbi:MAG TPA: PKD domain-containing protein, partial [Bacteroidia bacterium]|nr:PKD domain-containing protein [Bacteroidia bacterium]